jgi:hypothetical protein
MTIALTISSYLLQDFVELGLRQILKIFPGSPVLVSDDFSPRSESIADMATTLGATYIVANTRRGHFAGDCQSTGNSISFAQAHNADIAIKVSQRFIFVNPICHGLILRAFEDGKIDFALPGPMPIDTLRPGGSAGFSHFPVLTDLMMFRTSACDTESMVNEYKAKVTNEWGTPTGTFIEALAKQWIDGRFKGRSLLMGEFTKHVNGRSGGDLYLRRNQNHQHTYRELARLHGINGDFLLDEWQKIDGAQYWPRPRA